MLEYHSIRIHSEKTLKVSNLNIGTHILRTFSVWRLSIRTFIGKKIKIRSQYSVVNILTYSVVRFNWKTQATVLFMFL